MGLFRIARIAIAAVVAAGLTAGAFADMRSFNAAVKAGDYRKAAEEAKATWVTWDKSHADTAVVAREFGFASYVAGDFAAAREYGIFLRDKGKSLTKPDDQPVSSAVLLAAADFRLGPGDATRTALLNALKAREPQPGIDNLSVLAAEALYKSDWAKGDWAKAGESSSLAWRLMDRAGAQLKSRALDARAASAAAGFLGGPDKQDYDAVVDAHDAVVAAIDAEMNTAKRLGLAPLKYQLEAWAISVFLYFDASQQTGSNIPIKVRERTLKQPSEAMFPDSVTTGDACEQLDASWPTMRYPQAAAYRDMVGTVILKLDIDAQGRVSGWETLAAVPARHFAETIEEELPNLVFRPAAGSKPGCSLVRKSMIFKNTFRID